MAVVAITNIDKRFILVINGNSMPCGWVYICCTLSPATRAYVRRNCVRGLVVIRYRGYLYSCRKPPRYVPYKCTYVPYNGTFGASDQGQMLDLWGWHPADVNAELVVTPDVTTSSRKIPWTSQDISVGISADLLDHMGWIQGWIQLNGCSVC
jgi:hypothetical protein